MYDTIARLHVAGDQIDAGVTYYDNYDSAFYNFGDDNPDVRGMITVKPSRLGIHPAVSGVCVTFGPGVGTDGVDIDNWNLVGSVLATPVGTVGMYPYTDQYPISQVRKDDPAAADVVEDLVRAVAAHYMSTYAGRGVR